MRAINNLLPKANDALTHNDISIVNAHGVVTKGVIEGHIAGFGAMVINLDLLPTVAVYMDDVNRRQVIKAMAKMLELDDENALYNKVLNTEKATLAERRLLKEQVVNTSVALKMMIRTYQIVKEND